MGDRRRPQRRIRSEIIAEIGQNHNGDMRLATRLIREAKKNGADVAKFQLFDVDHVFGELYKLNPALKRKWYALQRKSQLTREQVSMLADECRRSNIEFLASVFDVERVAWLEDVGVRRHKIASRSVGDRKLTAALVKTGKPLLVSLGMWKGRSFPRFGPATIVEYLYCVSKYPAPLSDVRLATVDFHSYAGFSDHTVGVTAAIAAMARGARIIEKHFTLAKKMFGPDHGCSMTPDELRVVSAFRDELVGCW